MGVLDLFKPGPARTDRALRASVTPIPDPSTYPIATPWGSADLARIVFEEMFGSDVPANTRSAAMRLAGMARARNLVVSTIAGMPLAALRRDERLPDPPWFWTCHDGSTPQHCLAWTVDDLIFYGWSLWEFVLGADKFPLSHARIDYADWTIDGDNRLRWSTTDEPIVNSSSTRYVLIPGLHEGVLTYGCDVIRDTRALYAIVRERLNNPVPQVDLHQTGGRQLNKDEIADLRSDWALARSGANGGVAYTNEWIEAKPFGVGGENLLIEARNAAVLDLARLVGVHGATVDATTPKASLNYETTSGRNEELVDFDLNLYMLPIRSRLSLDDVTPHGTRIAFDLADFTSTPQDPTGPVTED